MTRDRPPPRQLSDHSHLVATEGLSPGQDRYRGVGRIKPAQTDVYARMSFSEDLLCVFTAQVEERNGVHVIEVPEREVALGDVEENDTYRVAMLLDPSKTPSSSESGPTSRPEQDTSEPPVEEGDVVDVEIEDIGEQGDGIARVGPGYVVIVSDTEMGERVSVEITDVRQNMAFGEVVERYDRMS